MRPFATIEKSLPSPTEPFKITDIIHQVRSHDCPIVYINPTKRDLKSQLSEHKKSIKHQQPEESALCEHLGIILDHRMDWNGVTIL